MDATSFKQEQLSPESYDHDEENLVDEKISDEPLFLSDYTEMNGDNIVQTVKSMVPSIVEDDGQVMTDFPVTIVRNTAVPDDDMFNPRFGADQLINCTATTTPLPEKENEDLIPLSVSEVNNTFASVGPKLSDHSFTSGAIIPNKCFKVVMGIPHLSDNSTALSLNPVNKHKTLRPILPKPLPPVVKLEIAELNTTGGTNYLDALYGSSSRATPQASMGQPYGNTSEPAPIAKKDAVPGLNAASVVQQQKIKEQEPRKKTYCQTKDKEFLKSRTGVIKMQKNGQLTIVCPKPVKRSKPSLHKGNLPEKGNVHPETSPKKIKTSPKTASSDKRKKASPTTRKRALEDDTKNTSALEMQQSSPNQEELLGIRSMSCDSLENVGVETSTRGKRKRNPPKRYVDEHDQLAEKGGHSKAVKKEVLSEVSDTDERDAQHTERLDSSDCSSDKTIDIIMDIQKRKSRAQKSKKNPRQTGKRRRPKKVEISEEEEDMDNEFFEYGNEDDEYANEDNEPFDEYDGSENLNDDVNQVHDDDVAKDILEGLKLQNTNTLDETAEAGTEIKEDQGVDRKSVERPRKKNLSKGQKVMRRLRKAMAKNMKATPAKTMLLYCGQCDVDYTATTDKGKHLDCGTVPSKVQCEVCRLFFRSKKSVLNHKQLRHTVSQAVTCECGKIFNNKRDAKAHRPTCVKFQVFRGRARGVSGPYTCETCGQIFNRIKLYTRHLKKEHNRINDPSSYICKVCGKEFLRVTSLLNHEKYVHASPNVKCPFCEKKVKNKVALLYHIQTHRDIMSSYHLMGTMSKDVRPDLKSVGSVDRENSLVTYEETVLKQASGLMLQEAESIEQVGLIQEVQSAQEAGLIMQEAGLLQVEGLLKEAESTKGAGLIMQEAGLMKESGLLQVEGLLKEAESTKGAELILQEDRIMKDLQTMQEAQSYPDAGLLKEQALVNEEGLIKEAESTKGAELIMQETGLIQEAQLTQEMDLKLQFKYHCPLCEHKYNINTHMMAHVLQMHGMVTRRSKDLENEGEGGSEIRGASMYLNPRFLCQLCGKKFYQKNTYNDHLAIHNGKVTEKCKECGREFITKTAYQRHMRRTHLMYSDGTKIVTPPQKQHVACPICGITLHKSAMQKHVDKHNGVYRFTCSVCGKKCRCHYDLKNHERTHTGEQPYTCDICGRKFNDRANLRHHEKRIHNMNNPKKQNITVVGFHAM